MFELDKLSFGHRVTGPTVPQNIRFLLPEEVPAQTTTFRQGDRARMKVGRVVLRVGYAKVPADYTEEVAQILHRAGSPAHGSALNEIEKRFGLRIGRRARKKLIDALAYARAVQDGFGGPARGVVVSDRPDLVGHEFRVFDVRRHQLGTRYSGGGGTSFPYDDYEPPGLDGRRTIVTVDTGLSLVRANNRRDGVRVLTGDLELVARRPHT